MYYVPNWKELPYMSNGKNNCKTMHKAKNRLSYFLILNGLSYLKSS